MKNKQLILSTLIQREILDRDKQYEAGETETYSLEEIITYFKIEEEKQPSRIKPSKP
jgi:hypothetical protein